MSGGAHPSRDEFVSLAREWSIVPVWRELLADLTTPVAAYARLVQDEPGFVLESVEHAGTWGRWSFIGRRPSATMTLRQGGCRWKARSRRASLRTAGSWRPWRPCFPITGPRRCPGCLRSTEDFVGYLGYDVVREVEQLPDAPPDELGYPDAIVGVVGQIAAYDAWRQRVTLVEAVPVSRRVPPPRTPTTCTTGRSGDWRTSPPRGPSRSKSR